MAAKARHLRVLGLATLAATLAAPALASFAVPDSVYRMDRLDDAVQAARSRSVPLTFIYTDESTTCGLATAASVDTIEALQSDTVVVYASTKVREDWARMPALVKRAIRAPESGRFIPKTVIVSADLSVVRHIVPYVRDVAERRAALQQVRSDLR